MIYRLIFFTLLLTSTSSVFSQSNTFSQLKNKIHEKYPDLSLEDHIIAVNYWTVDDEQSRKNSVAFEKTVKVYHGAILKGGREGMIVISINGDNLNPEATIVLNKENIKLSFPFTAEETANIIPGKWCNVVYDSRGIELYRNLQDTQVFPSILNLVTR